MPTPNPSRRALACIGAPCSPLAQAAGPRARLQVELSVPAPRREEGWGRRNYLDQVIKPMYGFLKAEMVKKNVVGVLAEHIYKKNYDDINEFFWKRECVSPEFSLRAEANDPSVSNHRQSAVELSANKTWSVNPLLNKALRQQVQPPPPPRIPPPGSGFGRFANAAQLGG